MSVETRILAMIQAVGADIKLLRAADNVRPAILILGPTDPIPEGTAGGVAIVRTQ